MPSAMMNNAAQDRYGRSGMNYFEYLFAPEKDEIYNIEGQDLRFSRILDSNAVKNHNMQKVGTVHVNLASPAYIQGLYDLYLLLQEWFTGTIVSISNEIFVIVTIFRIMFNRFNFYACPELYKAYSYMRWIENMIYFERARHYIINGDRNLMISLVEIENTLKKIINSWYLGDVNAKLTCFYEKILVTGKDTRKIQMDREANRMLGFNEGAGDTWVYVIIRSWIHDLAKHVNVNYYGAQEDDELVMDEGAMQIILKKVMGIDKRPFDVIVAEGAFSNGSMVTLGDKEVPMNPRFERLMNAYDDPVPFKEEEVDKAFDLIVQNIMHVEELTDMFSPYTINKIKKFEKYRIHNTFTGKFETREKTKSCFDIYFISNFGISQKLDQARSMYLSGQYCERVPVVFEHMIKHIASSNENKPIPVKAGVSQVNDLLDAQENASGKTKISPIEFFNRQKYVKPKRTFHLKVSAKMDHVKTLGTAIFANKDEITATAALNAVKLKYKKALEEEIKRLSKILDSKHATIKLWISKSELKDIEYAEEMSLKIKFPPIPKIDDIMVKTSSGINVIVPLLAPKISTADIKKKISLDPSIITLSNQITVADKKIEELKAAYERRRLANAKIIAERKEENKHEAWVSAEYDKEPGPKPSAREMLTKFSWNSDSFPYK